MDILYKYTSYFGINSLTDHHLRLSIPSTLNDPFEGIFNEKLENEMFDKFDFETLKIHVAENSHKKTKDAIKRMTIRDIIDVYGIISLSETPRNLLMWAHYANEHNGICIGYKPDLFKDIILCPDSRLKLESKEPIRVTYDNLRPHETKSGCADIAELIKDLKNHFTTKSDEWIYEKEHRFIIPLKWATKIKLLGETANDSTLIDTVRILTKGNMLTKIDGINNHEYLIKHFTQVHEFAENYKSVAYLIKVDPSKIKSIHFGCKFEPQEMENIKNLLSANHSKLNHVKLYKFTPSRSRFELISQEI